jgi:hypothetical protein
MANVTLAPEDDEPDFHQGLNFSLPQHHKIAEAKGQRQSRDGHSRFNPKKVGFGLLPWPGVDDREPVPAPAKDTFAIALQYLLEGPSYSDKESEK